MIDSSHLCSIMSDSTQKQRATDNPPSSNVDYLPPAALASALRESDQVAELHQTIAQLQNQVQSLQMQQALLQQVIDNTNATIFVKDYRRSDGAYILINKVAIQAPQIQASPQLLNDYDLFPQEIAELFRRADREILVTGKSQRFEEVEPHTDGLHATLVAKFPIFDPAGEIYAVGGISYDISALKQAEEALRLQEEALLACSNGIVIADMQQPDGPLVFVNPAFEAMTGYTAAEAIGQNWRLLHGPATDPKTIRQLHEAIKAGESCTVTLQNYRKDGTPFWNQLTISPIFDAQQQVTHYLGIQVDVSDRQRLEAERQQAEVQLRQQTIDLENTLSDLRRTQSQLVQSEKMSSLGQLVAGVAHEINNPVSFIYGNLEHADAYIQALLDLVSLYQQHYPEPVEAISEAIAAMNLAFVVEDLPKTLDSMKVGAERIHNIVLSLRTFSRAADRIDQAADLHAGIDSTLMILKGRLQTGRIPIQVVKEYGELPLLQCYAGQLNQVFMNLLVNAIDAIESTYLEDDRDQPAPTITITTQRIDQQVVIQISDNGPGMDELVLARLFDPFFTTKPVGKGTGLGLSICYQIITEKHQGQLTCRSALGKGAQFTIFLPIQLTAKSMLPDLNKS
jgi:two-component system, NtrC family, sensor kinase